MTIDKPTLAVYRLDKLSNGKNYQSEGVDFRLSPNAENLTAADITQHRIWQQDADTRKMVGDVSYSTLPQEPTLREVRNNLVTEQDVSVTFNSDTTPIQNLASKFSPFIEIANDTLIRVREAATKMQAFVGASLVPLSTGARSQPTDKSPA